MLYEEAMSHPPMEELLLPSTGQRHTVVCYGLKTTGLELVDEIVQIGGTVGQANPFSQYIVPATRRIHPDMAKIISLQVLDDGKGLQDLQWWCVVAKRSTRIITLRCFNVVIVCGRSFPLARPVGEIGSNTLMDTVDERSALEKFLSWLEEVKGDTDGIILANYDSNSLEIPVLLIALRRHSLTDCFKHIVIGFCNTYTIFLADLKIRNYTLQALYEQFIGRRPEKYRAHEDAIDLHTILTKYFKTEQLSIEIPRLVQATYTVRCMEEYFSWRETTEPHRVGLMTIAASCNMQEMLKEVLVNNLMAAGYTHKKLADEYSMYGDRKFKHRLEQSILRMKSRYESHLTNTKIMSASSVTNRVLEHFRRLF